MLTLDQVLDGLTVEVTPFALCEARGDGLLDLYVGTYAAQLLQKDLERHGGDEPILGDYLPEEQAAHLTELYLAKRKDEATAAVPNEFVDQGTLIGDEQRIRRRFRDWEDCGVTGMTVSGDERALRLMAEVARLNVEPGA